MCSLTVAGEQEAVGESRFIYHPKTATDPSGVSLSEAEYCPFGAHFADDLESCKVWIG